MDYIIKSFALLLIFYLCYRIFLERDTFFQTNRWFLLFGLITAVCLPLIVITNYIEYTPVASALPYSFGTSSSASIPLTTKMPFDYLAVASYIYVVGLIIFFGKLSIELLSLQKVIKKSKAIDSTTSKLFETTEDVAPFSFFNYIVYNPKHFQDDDLAYVINHEQVHVKQYHSVDIIIAQMACIIFWFNPIVWLYKKVIQQNLEFIADHEAQQISACEKSYQNVLLKTSVPQHELHIANNFYTSLIKKRIIMLHKPKTQALNRLKPLVIFPLLALFMMSFNTEDVYVKITEPNTRDTNISRALQERTSVSFDKDNSDSYLEQIKASLAKKGITFTYGSIRRNANDEITAILVKFESSTKNTAYKVRGKQPIQPFIFESSTDEFVVRVADPEKDFIYAIGKGDSTYISKPKTPKQPSNGKNNIKSNEKKTQVNTKTTTYEEDILLYKDVDNHLALNGADINAVQFFLNGKKVPKSKIESLDANTITSVEILKGDQAIKAYGATAKEGAIIISTAPSKSKGWAVVGVPKVERIFEIDTFQDSITSPSGKKVGITRVNTLDYDYIPKVQSGVQPLIVIDGKIVVESSLRDLDPNDIESLTVLKDNKATAFYGDQGKNGVILITTKSLKKSFRLKHDQDSTTIEAKNNNPWEIKTELNSVVFTDDNNEITAEFIITKNSTDDFLERQKKELKSLDIVASFSKIKRNKKGELIGIKIYLNDKNGQKSTAAWKSNNNTIPDIIMGKSKDDDLYIRALGE
ncbi:M56 family metallopeptidase [Psychroserpens sp.]|uniref:M56 family metallopeptidase n=1 Tax=Psychroserpens sp. TaxID=2020870 RepID=UPI003C774346